MNWWNVFRALCFVLYFIGLLGATIYYTSFYETTRVRESVRVSYGNWEIKEYSEERHTNPRKRKEEAMVTVIALALAVVLIALIFLDTPPW